MTANVVLVHANCLDVDASQCPKALVGNGHFLGDLAHGAATFLKWMFKEENPGFSMCLPVALEPARGVGRDPLQQRHLPRGREIAAQLAVHVWLAGNEHAPALDGHFATVERLGDFGRLVRPKHQTALARGVKR